MIGVYTIAIVRIIAQPVTHSEAGSQYKLTSKFTLLPEHTQSRATLAEWLRRQASNPKVRGSNPGARSADEPQQGRNRIPLLH